MRTTQLSLFDKQTIIHPMAFGGTDKACMARCAYSVYEVCRLFRYVPLCASVCAVRSENRTRVLIYIGSQGVSGRYNNGFRVVASAACVSPCQCRIRAYACMYTRFFSHRCSAAALCSRVHPCICERVFGYGEFQEWQRVLCRHFHAVKTIQYSIHTHSEVFRIGKARCLNTHEQHTQLS